MPLLDAAAVLLVLASAFGLLNHHVLKLPFAIGLLVSGLLASFCLLGLEAAIPATYPQAAIPTEPEPAVSGVG